MKVTKIKRGLRIIGFLCPKCKIKVYLKKPFCYCEVCKKPFKEEFIKEVFK